MPRSDHTGIDAIERAQRRARAVELRSDGRTIRQIAEELGVSVATVHDDIQRALDAVPAEAVGTLRMQEQERLDRLQQAVWGAAMDGDLSAVDRALKIIERRCKLMGLDSPQQVEMVGATDLDLDAAVRDLVAAARTEPISWEELTRDQEES